MNDKIIEKYFKDGETSQNTLEEIGMFEQIGKQYILTQDIDDINMWISMRVAIEPTKPHKSIQIPITDEDIIMFEDLVRGDREPFMWTFNKVNVEFITEEQENE